MNTKAMTLIEIMIAILLIGIVLSAIVALIPQVMVSDQKSMGVITATSLAQDRLESAQKCSFRNLYTLVEGLKTGTETSLTKNNNPFKRTTEVGYLIDSVDTINSKITDTDQTWDTDEWQYYIVTIAHIKADGTAEGKHYQISNNTANTITCSGADFSGIIAGTDYYYINLAPVTVTVSYQITVEATISPFEKISDSIGLIDKPAGVEYKHPTGKWQDIILKTILVENE